VKTPKWGSHPRCHPRDCRERPPVELARIKAALKIYVPDYMTAGPARCTVCRIPAFRSRLCQRHYQQVRKGAVEVTVEKTRPFHGDRTKLRAIYLPKTVDDAVKNLAEKAQKSVSKWLADLARAEVKKQTGYEPPVIASLFDYPEE
jgi:hypothetical protein